MGNENGDEEEDEEMTEEVNDKAFLYCCQENYLGIVFNPYLNFRINLYILHTLPRSEAELLLETQSTCFLWK